MAWTSQTPIHEPGTLTIKKLNLFDTFNVVLLTGCAVLALYPFVYTVAISLSTAEGAARDGLHLYPRDMTLTAYKMILGNREILIGYANTIGRTIVGCLATLLMTCLCAYPLSRPEMPHRRLIMVFIIFTMIFSGGVVPLYLVLNGLGLIDNRLVYVLPLMLTAFNTILVKSFFQQLPQGLGEAARLDGANEFYILFKIYMPLSKPVLATVGLWTVIMHWNMWFDGLVFIDSNSKQVMQVLLQRIVIESSTGLIEKGVINPDITMFTPETIKAATIVVTIVPTLLVYPFVQRFFVRGITLGSVKG